MFRRIWSHRAASAWRTRNASQYSSKTRSLIPAVSERRSPTLRGTGNLVFPCFLRTATTTSTGIRENQGSTSIARFISSKASHKPGKTGETTDKTKKDITNVEDPFSSPTYNIPEKPVTFVEGASYSVIILAGLGIAAAAGYAVFKELIFQPKEYKIYSKALKRIQDDGQVRVRIGSPITGYGQESRNRAARQRIPHRVWTDEDGVEHVEVNFYIRGPHGHGKVFSEMFKGPADNEWKFTYLIVEIRAPSSAQLILESYVPAYSPNQ